MPSDKAGPNSFRKNTLTLKVSGMNTLTLAVYRKLFIQSTLQNIQGERGT
jgi:hypothetical protein